MSGKAIIAAAIILGASFVGGVWLANPVLPMAVDKMLNSNRVVTVKGLAEREVKADRVYFPISFYVDGEDLNETVQRIELQKEEVLKFIANYKIPESDIHIEMPSVSDNKYVNSDRIAKYTITYKIVIDTHLVDVANTIMADLNKLIQKGISISDNRYEITFSYTKLNELKPVMVEEATRNAREVANKFAKDSGSSLGKIKNASQGVFSINSGSTADMKQIRVVSTVQYYLND